MAVVNDETSTAPRGRCEGSVVQHVSDMCGYVVTSVSGAVRRKGCMLLRVKTSIHSRKHSGYTCSSCR